MGKKKNKKYTVDVPSASAPTPVSADLDNLRNDFNQRYSLLEQQSTAQRQQYESQILGLQEAFQSQYGSLQSQYDQQVSLLGTQLQEQQNQYGLLQQQFQTQQEEARKQYEEQKTYYSSLLTQQQEQANRETEANRRLLMEAEAEQAELQKAGQLELQNSLLSSASRATPKAATARTNTASVTRNSAGYSLLRR